jgi:hypothetical protein
MEYLLKNKEVVLSNGEDYYETVIKSLDLYFSTHTEMDLDMIDEKYLIIPSKPNSEIDFMFSLGRMRYHKKNYYILEFISSVG